MLHLTTADPAFERKFARLVDDRRESGDDVSRVVADILSEVRQRGDKALSEYTQRFDKHSLGNDEDWRISPGECAAAYDALAQSPDRSRNNLTLLDEMALLEEITQVGQHQIGERSGGIAKEHAAIDDEPAPAGFIGGAVDADLAGTTERKDVHRGSLPKSFAAVAVDSDFVGVLVTVDFEKRFHFVRSPRH